MAIISNRSYSIAVRHLNGEPVISIAKDYDLHPQSITAHTHKVVGVITGWYVTDFQSLRKKNPRKFARIVRKILAARHNP